MSPEVYAAGLAAWTTAEPPHKGGTYTSEGCWAFVQRVLEPHVPPALLPAFRMQLASRHQTAKLEAQRQLALRGSSERAGARPCCFAVLDGLPDLLTSADAVREALERGVGVGGAQQNASSSQALRAGDHTLWAAPRRGAAPRPLVLYGPPGLECFRALHAGILAALRAAQPEGVIYVVRSVLLPGCQVDGDRVSRSGCLALGTEASPALPGFGVGLSIRNMEYNQACTAFRAPLALRALPQLAPRPQLLQACHCRRAVAGQSRSRRHRP